MTSPPQAQDLHGRGQELQRQERTAGKEGEVTAAESPSPMRRRDGSKRSEGRARLELALAGRLGPRAWMRVVGGAGRARTGTGGQARQRGDEVRGGGGNEARPTLLAAAAQGQG